jgi:hypothetical protein
MCVILGAHRLADEDYCVLVYDAMLICSLLPTFRSRILLPSSGLSRNKLLEE